MLPEHQFVICSGLEIHLTCWGSRQSPALIMWHGLTRTGRDFDELAIRLADQYFVICPDTPGRGLSQWCSEPEQHYTLPHYVVIAKAILQSLQIDQCRWIGTSMGGLIGILLAAEENSPINALLVNDVGPELPREAIQRIRDYVGIQPSFNSVSELEQWLRAVYVTFGDNTDTFWRRMAMTSARRLPDGRVTLHYDPSLVKGFAVPDADEEPHTLWPQWQAIECPLMIVQGALSDVLSTTQLNRMRTEQPSAEYLCVEGVGHAPTLVSDAQQYAIVDWLTGLK